jgi:hypothetical protein
VTNVLEPTFGLETASGALLFTSVAFVFPAYRGFTDKVHDFSLFQFVTHAPMYVKLLFVFSTATAVVGLCILIFVGDDVTRSAATRNWNLVARLAFASDVLIFVTVLNRAKALTTLPNNALQRSRG